MLRFNNPNAVTDWEYTVPHTGYKVQANSLLYLHEKVRAHLNANGFPDAVVTKDELHEINAQRHKKANPQCCYEDPSTSAEESSTFQMDDVARFTRTLFSNLAHGGKRVDQEEAGLRLDEVHRRQPARDRRPAELDREHRADRHRPRRQDRSAGSTGARHVVSRWLQMLVATLGGRMSVSASPPGRRIRGAGMPSHRMGICGNRPQPHFAGLV